MTLQSTADFIKYGSIYNDKNIYIYISADRIIFKILMLRESKKFICPA